MKRNIIIMFTILAVGGIGAWYYVGSQPTDYDAPETIVETVVEEVDALEVRLQERKDAEMDRINEEADAMRDAFVQKELDVVEGSFWRDIESEAAERATEKEKSSGVY